MYIHPTAEEDYTRIFLRRTWFIQGSPMTVSKWTLDFNVNQESSIIPLWVLLPSLPLHFFDKKYLFKLGSLIGRPLQVDSATLNLKRPSVTRLLVEVDVAKSTAPRIWIGDVDDGHWQKVEYEEWPKFCSFCEKVGHSDMSVIGNI
ncbi:uncharacterized protein [Coffea arabica]|uniref:DUF4283 domain-containing protein n=1 Tax=Coffea arabica TaxID=13443 RepID=A0ABM4WQ12_COFAR